MDRLSQIAQANYNARSGSFKASADEFFRAMKENGGLVDFVKFKDFMTSKGYDYYVSQKLFDSLGGKRALGSGEVITLYYIIKSGRPFCRDCKRLATSVYYACEKCYESSRGPYCICLSCYEHTDKHPKCGGDPSHFVDNFTMLENRRRLAVQKKADQLPKARAQPRGIGAGLDEVELHRMKAAQSKADQLREARAKDDFDLNRRPARRQTPTKLRRSQSVGWK